MIAVESDLTLPHPLAHLRAFVMIPWLAVDPDAELTVSGGPQPVARLLAELDPADRDGVRLYPSWRSNRNQADGTHPQA